MTYKFDLLTVLVLGHLLTSLLVQIGGLDLVLQEFQLFRLAAELLNLAPLSLVLDLHAGHLPSETLLHGLHVE